jgi:hypothetical protein
MKVSRLLFGSVCFLLLWSCAYAKQEPNESEYVSRKEYEALKKEFEELKSKLASIEEKAVSNEQTQQKIESLDKKLTEVKSKAESSALGDTKLLITGGFDAGFTNQKHSNSSFNVGFNPMFLWELNDRLLFQGDIDMKLTGPNQNGTNSGTDTKLSSAFLSYLLNDYATIGMGLFPVPFTAYHNHFDPAWINKLPSDPLIYGDNGIAPDTAVGVFVTGAYPNKQSKINYAAWVTNGPALITEDPASAGSLNFDNFNDQNNNKAIGGRLGLMLTPSLEIGYSAQYSKVSPDNFKSLTSTMQGIDLNYVKKIDSIKGRLTTRGAYVWSQLGKATYDPTGVHGFGPLRFNNNRDGGYIEMAYRPTEVEDKFLKNLEFVLRYDRLNVASAAPGGGNRSQWTSGIDYWITPKTVFKTAYTFDNQQGGPGQSGFFVQLATGF